VRIQEAAERFADFTGHEVDYIDTVQINSIDVAFKVGMCDGILYTTVRDGKTERYIHEFKKTARPILASNYNGTQLLLLKGKFRFTERGIVDR